MDNIKSPSPVLLFRALPPSSLSSSPSLLSSPSLSPPSLTPSSLSRSSFLPLLWKTWKWEEFDIESEYHRLGFSSEEFQISDINRDFKVTPSYPQRWIVPQSTSIDTLHSSLSCRSRSRSAVVTWRSSVTGRVLARSAQPQMMRCLQNSADLNVLLSIAKAVESEREKEKEREMRRVSKEEEEDGDFDKTVLRRSSASLDPENIQVEIFDCRSMTSAYANKLQGGGVEIPSLYPHCHVTFLSIANIHTVRSSFFSILSLLLRPIGESWLSDLQWSRWLNHSHTLLRAASQVARSLSPGSLSAPCILVHCSDGWDRTAQVTSLAQILLDPFYRTLEG